MIVSTFNFSCLFYSEATFLFRSNFLHELVKATIFGLLTVSTFNVRMLLGPLHRKLFKYCLLVVLGKLGNSLCLVLY